MGNYGLPRAAGPGLTHPVEETVSNCAAVKRPCTAGLTSPEMQDLRFFEGQ